MSGDKIKGDKISKFSERKCKNGSLGVLDRGYELMPKLMELLRK
jgi:2,3-bisphosphoglycerate-independent phosphoglycerate mutase